MAPNLNKIKEDFDKVIRFSQNIPDPKTERLFEVWQEAKRDFIEAFGGEYIFELPGKVSFDLGEKEKHKRIMRFVEMVFNHWGYEDLALFIEAQEPGFFQNLTVKDYTTANGTVIKKGAKLVRAFKYFVNKGRGLTDIQNEASRIIQEDKIEGRLCLSVHPLDFLSSSENTYNWRSCHSLDGEYRAGNLSYMMDRSTVICYLKADEDVNLQAFGPEVKWNSKKWRVLLHISEDWRMIFAGRQYPFESAAGMDIVLNKLLIKAGICYRPQDDASTYWTPWCGDMIKETVVAGQTHRLNDSFVYVGGDLMGLHTLMVDALGSKQYNDVLYSSCYNPIYTIRGYHGHWNDELTTSPIATKFVVGEMTYCLWCGEEECLSGADTMLGEKCELAHGSADNEMFTFCDCCGRRMYSDDAYIVGDEEVCYECFNTQCSTCEECGEAVWNEDIHYNEATDQYLCTWCLQEQE